eukprot:s69_g13.t1
MAKVDSSIGHLGHPACSLYSRTHHRARGCAALFKMMESMEEGRTPLAPVAQQESKRIIFFRILLSLSIVMDAILVPLLMWSPFSFQVDQWWSQQVAAWRLDASVADWLMIAWIRDVLLAAFFSLAWRKQVDPV